MVEPQQEVAGYSIQLRLASPPLDRQAILSFSSDEQSPSLTETISTRARRPASRLALNSGRQITQSQHVYPGSGSCITACRCSSHLKDQRGCASECALLRIQSVW